MDQTNQNLKGGKIMKVQSEVLKNTDITTTFGKFHVDANGIANITDDAAQELIDDGLFTKMADSKNETKEEKVESPKKESK